VRRFVLAAVTALAASAFAPALASAKGFHKRTLHVIVHVGPRQATKCNVIADLYKPNGASRSRPVPAVLTTNGFGGSKNDQAGLAANLASRGFAVLSYSGLGFGNSSCRIELDNPQWDGKAASELVTFLGGGSAATDGTRVNYVIHDKRAHNGRHYADDPRLAMIGASYGGEVQFAAAEQDPRIDAIVPMITWNNLAYSLAPNNAGLTSAGGLTAPAADPGITKLGWLNAFIFIGNGSPEVPPLGGSTACPNFAATLCAPASELTTLGYPTPSTLTYTGQDSVASYIKRIKIPVMLMQGEDDTLFNLNEAIQTYRSLRKQHTPVKMVWQSWGHSHLAGVNGEIGKGLGIVDSAGRVSVEGQMVLDWFDHYLKGTGPMPALNFSFYRPWVRFPGDHAARAYASAPRYPIGRGQDFALSGSDSLVSFSGGTAPAAGASFTTPAAGAPESQTEQSGTSQTIPLTDPAGTFAEYESAPLSRNLDVVGIPTVNVDVETPSRISSLGLYFKLEDIAPNGTVTLPDRLIAPARFTLAPRAIGPVCKPGVACPDFVIAGSGGGGKVTLPGIAHRFPAGDRIAFVIAGSDSSYSLASPDVAVTLTGGSLSLPVAGANAYGPLSDTAKR
jgi:pimeloyl-ACP methyl ester carboxylesterase